MAMLDDIYTMAAVFAGPSGDEEQAALRTVCQAVQAGLSARLRPGITPETCEQAFVCAAAWMAVCCFGAGMSGDGVTAFSAGDISVSLGAKNAAAEALRTQAELLMAPYVRDSFCFLGVRA